MPKQTALITGASGGIGYALAEVFAKEGFDLVLVARSEEKLVSLADSLKKKHSVDAEYIVKDLTHPAAPQDIFIELKEKKILIPVLINNAGVGVYGRFAETDADENNQLIQLNITALTSLTRLFLPEMIQNGYGKILNVASVAGFQPGPLLSTYFASKAYVISFSEAIRYELNGTGVSVTTLCPGPVKTNFMREAKMEESGLARGDLADAAKIAKIAYLGLMKNRNIIIPDLKYKIIYLLTRLAPRKLTTIISGMVTGAK